MSRYPVGVPLYTGIDPPRLRVHPRAAVQQRLNPTRPQKGPKIAIICTKEHEFKLMSDVVYLNWRNGDYEEMPELTTTQDFLIHRLFCFPNYTVQIFSFGKEQGGVTCAMRVPLILRYCRPKAIIMHGICGGKHLGQVIVATSSYGWDIGRKVIPQKAKPKKSKTSGAGHGAEAVAESSQSSSQPPGDPYKDDHELDEHHATISDKQQFFVEHHLRGGWFGKRSGDGYRMKYSDGVAQVEKIEKQEPSPSSWMMQLPVMLHEEESERAAGRDEKTTQKDASTVAPSTSLDPFNVVNGVMLSVTKVRDDVKNVMEEFRKLKPKHDVVGIEMESYALLSLSRMFKLEVIAIVKGTSDVGEYDQEPDNAEILAKWTQASAESSSRTDNSTNRRGYRAIASTNAAIITWEIVQHWIKNKQRTDQISLYMSASESDSDTEMI